MLRVIILIQICSLGTLGQVSGPRVEETDGYRVYSVESSAGDLESLYMAVNDVMDLQVSADNAENAHFTILFGDGAGQTVCGGGVNEVVLAHTYPGIGTYNMDVFIGDSGSDVTMGVDVHVVHPLPSPGFYHFTSTPGSDVISPFVAQFTVERDVALSALDFRNVTCAFMEYGVSMEQFMLDISNTSDLPVTKTWVLADTGVHEIAVVCDNLITTSTDSVEVHVHQRLTNITLLVRNADKTTTFGSNTRYVFSVGDDVEFQVIGVGGTLGNHEYRLDTGDGLIEKLSLTPHNSSTAIVRHTFNEAAYFKQSLTVNDSIGFIGTFALYISDYADADSGVYVYDIDMESLVLSSASGKTLLYEDEGAEDTYQVTVDPLTNPARVPVETQCSWFWPGSSEVKNTTNFTLATVQSTLVSFQYSVHQINHTLRVDCQTPLGNISLDSEVSVVKYLNNATLSVLEGDFLVINTINTIALAFLGGDFSVNITLDVNDTSVFVGIVPFPGGEFLFPYNFSSSGVHVVRATITDGKNSFTPEFKVFVLTKVDGLVLYMNEVNQEPLTVVDPNTTVDFSLSVELYPATVLLPMQVACLVDYDKGQSESFAVGNMNKDLGNAFNFSHTFDYLTGEAERNVTINCTNRISHQVLTGVVFVARKLINVTIASDVYQIFEEKIPITVTGSGGELGTHFAFAIPGETLVEYDLPFTGQFSHYYEFPRPGRYDVTVYVWDVSANYTLTHTFLVQKTVEASHLQFTGLTDTLNEAALLQNFSLRIVTLNAEQWPPTNVTCDWNFANLQETVLVTDVNSALFLPAYEISYVFRLEDGQNQTIQINCSNEVSSQLKTQHFWIKRVLQDFSVTVASTSSQVHLSTQSSEALQTHCESTASLCVLPNNHIVFNVTGTYGDFPISYDLTSLGAQDVNQSTHDDFLVVGDMSVFPPGDWSATVTAESVLTHTVTVNALVQVSVASFGAVSIRGSTRVAIPMSTPLTYTIDTPALDMINSNLYPPTNASCVWMNLTGDEVGSVIPVSHMTDFLHTSLSASFTFTATETMNTTIKIRCFNMVSTITREIDITLVRTLADLAMEYVPTTFPQFYCIVGTPCDYSVTGRYGQLETEYTVSFGDGIPAVTNTLSEFANFSVSHTYTAAGVYGSSIYVNYSGGSEQYDCCTVYVQQILEDLTLTTSNTPGTIPTGLVNFTLTAVDVSLNPTNVTCVWHHPDNNNVTVEHVFEAGTVVQFNYTLDPATVPGLLTTSVECSNEVSSAVTEVSYLMLEKITELALTSSKEFAAQNENVTFTVSRLMGSNVTYLLEFGGAGPPTQTLDVGDDLADIAVNVSYPDEGVYYVNVTAFNPAESVEVRLSPVHSLTIQKLLIDLSLTDSTSSDSPGTPNHFPYPPGELMLTVHHQPMNQPLTVYFDWDLGDDTVVFGDVPPNAWSMGHERLATYTIEEIGEISILVRAHNNISEQKLGVNVTLVEVIGGLTLTAHVRYTQPGEELQITAQVVNGSHLNYSIDFGDNVTESVPYNTAFVYQPEVLNRIQLFSHAYQEPGNYTLTLIAANPESTDTVSLDHTVQYPVPDLLLIADVNPVVTPPGEMYFSVNRTDNQTYLPNDVTCEWTYTDGTQPDVLRYHPQWDIALTTHFHSYTPTAETLAPVVTVTISCSNEVTPVPKTSTVDVIIDANHVILGKFKDSGPVKPGNSLTWTLQIKNYGYDPCFLWTFTNVSYSVLYGRTQCQSQPQFIGQFNEFHLSTEMDDLLTYTKLFSIAPDIHVDVLAVNGIGSDTASDVGLILDEPCYPPTVSVGTEGLDIADPRIESQSTFIVINGVADTNCTYKHEYHVLWSVVLLSNVGEETAFESSDLIVDKLDFTVLSYTLPVGLYRVTLQVTMRGLQVLVDTDASLYLEIIPAELQVQISGGMERLVSSLPGNTIVVDAFRESRDPSIQQAGNKTDMTWKWVCTKAQDVSVFSGYDWSLNSGVEMGDCGVNPQVTPGSLLWQGDHLIDDSRYAVAVELSKPDGRTVAYTQILNAQPMDVFDIEIDCVRNCGDIVNGGSVMRVQARCLSDVCSNVSVPTYRWSFELQHEVSEEFENVTIPMDIFSDTLLVAANTFLKGRTYKILLEGEVGALQGRSAFSFHVNYPPFEGTCVANITHGYAMETQFVITCTQWRDMEEENLLSRRKRSFVESNAPNLLYSVYMTVREGDTFEEKLLSHSRDPVIRGTYLPVGDPLADYLLPIFVVITDTLGLADQVDIQVQNVPRVGPDSRAQLLDYFLELKKAADGGDIQKTTQLFWTMDSLQQPDILPTVLSPVTDDLLIDLYSGPEVNETELLQSNISAIESDGYYIQQMAKLQPVSPPELQQILEVLESVVSNTSAFDPIVDTSLGLEVMDNVISGAASVSEHLSTEELLDLLTAAVFTTGQLLDAASVHAGELLEANSCNRTGCEDDTVLARIKQNNEPLVDKVFFILDIAAELALRDAVPGEPPIAFWALDNKVVVTAEKVVPVDLAGRVIRTRMGLAQLPYDDAVFSNVTAECVQAIGIAFETNPFTWHGGASEVIGPVQNIRLLDCETQNLQHLLNVTTEEDNFHMEANFDESEWKATELGNTATDLAYHSFLMNNTESYAQIFFHHHTEDVTMEIFVIFEGDPNVNDFDFTDVLPKGMPVPIPGDREERVAHIQNLTQGGVHSYVLPRSLTNQQGLYTVGVLATAHDESGSALTSINYTFYVQFIHCRLWFDHLETWGENDCTVQDSSTPTRVKFKSKVFPSSFGAGLKVGPNTIDFGTVFEDGLSKLLANIHVLVTILLFLVAYFTLLPFAVKYDREDKINWMPLPIMCLSPADHFEYVVDVYTGIQGKSGTESNVYLVLIGNDAETDNVQLVTPERKNFKRGSMNRFTVGSKFHLGKITYIHIYHDNSGQGDKADWYLDKIMVFDKKEQKKYLFYCNSWLSLSRPNASLRCVLRLVSHDELLQNKGMLKRRMLMNVMEDNLWVSTLFRRNENHFSRVQRLSAATAFVFLSMISSAMWYGRGDSDSPTDGIQIGPVSFTLQSVIVSIYGLLTVLPAVLLILLLFMKSKRRQAKTQLHSRENLTITPPPPYSETLQGGPPNEKEPRSLAYLKGRNLDIYGNIGNSLSITSVNGDEDGDSLSDINPNVNNNNSSGGDQFIVKSADMEDNRKSTILQKVSSHFLPFWCVPVAYFLCFCAVVLSGFFTILYSFEWGSAKSSQWLGAFCLSFIGSEGVISPVKAILLAVLISLLCRIPTDHSDEFYEDCKDLVFDEDPHDTSLTRGVESQINQRYMKARLVAALRGLFWHALFLLCLILVTFGNRDPNSYRTNEELKSLYYGEAEHVANQAEFWDYLRDTAIPRLFLQLKYNGQSVDVLHKEFIDNTQARRLGPPALRQFRVKPISCEPVVSFEVHCTEDYDQYTNEDKRSYLPGWNIQGPNVSYTEQESAVLQAFLYDRGDAVNYNYAGYFGSYSGRGYAQSLGITETEAEDILHQLIEFDWLDRYSRAAVLEFNVYNANVNLFSLVSIVFEFPSVGAALIRSDVSSVKLYRYIGTWGVFNLMSEAIVIIFIIAMVVRLCIHTVREGKAYFRSLWNCVEAVKLVLGLGAVAMYMTRTLLIQSTVTYMMNNREQLVNFRGVTLADDFFIYLIGFMLFLQVLQLCQVFKFNRSLGVLGGTLRHSIRDLASFGVVVFIIFMAFLMVNYIYYGKDLWDYRNPLQGAYAQISAMLGHFRANEFEESAGFFGRITFTLFMLIMVFIYINMLVVIIMDFYADVNSGKLDIGDAHKAVDLLTENFKN